METATLTRSTSFPNHLHVGSDALNFLPRTRTLNLSPRSATSGVHLKMNQNSTPMSNPIRRARSDAELFVSDRTSRVRQQPATLSEEELFGGGDGNNVVGGGGGGGDSGGDENNVNERIENYYKEMLRSDPSNPLILRNYGKFLHEVEGDVKRAEECYSRAIVLSPNDGDVLSLYGKLVWETQRDEERAESYFERAVQASPDDCYVLGSYASFLWDAEEEEMPATSSSTLVEVF